MEHLILDMLAQPAPFGYTIHTQIYLVRKPLDADDSQDMLFQQNAGIYTESITLHDSGPLIGPQD